jgi:predicted RNase H-like HicB family nuclease
LNSIFKQAGLKPMKYLIGIEQTGTGFSAYSPDLPGCVATGGTRAEVEREIAGAIAFHLEGLKAEGIAIPRACSSSSYIEVPACANAPCAHGRPASIDVRGQGLSATIR